jgi:predicted metalloprotease
LQSERFSRGKRERRISSAHPEAQMRWQGGRRSTNVEDMRGSRVPMMVGGGGIGAVILALIALALGVDPGAVLQGGGSEAGAPAAYPGDTVAAGEGDEASDFVRVVLADTEDTWAELFRQMGDRYQDPKLVLFTGAVQSACGFAQAAVGPFYCPRDQKVYLDLGFFDELRQRFGAPGDFAEAYVIAHEIGHHVQTLLGITQQVDALRARSSQREANALSVLTELQADCFAGVWAHHATTPLDPGDIDEALRAASAIGDDKLQKEAQGYVVPESFTHGTSAQRVSWFRRGYQSGEVRQCDTFAAAGV